jgi:hypothetical protein
MTHSPAPWNIETHAGHARGLRYVICAPDYENRVAVISVNGAPHGDEEIAQDNANLITAAPELLMALNKIVEILEHSESYGILSGRGIKECESIAHAAIAKTKVIK